jgi:hypothetical protein
MNSKSRLALAPILAHCLHTDFRGEQYDDFVNYQYEGHTLRVVRFVGPGRCLLVFKYPTLPTHKWDTTYWHSQTLSFLAEDGSLVPFDHKAVEAEWKAQHPGKSINWEKVITAHVVARGAQEFRGTNWAGRISAALVHITNEWLTSHNLGGV